MADLATTLLQSPEVRQAQQRSKYLQEALAAMQSEAPKISSGKEFLTRSLARALTQYSSMKADKKLNEAAASDFANQRDALINSLMPPPQAPDSPQMAPQGPTAPVEMPQQAQPAPQPVAPQMTPQAHAGPLSFLAPSAARITSGFGPRTPPRTATGHGSAYHGGIDYGDAPGTEVPAAADGVVELAGPKGGYGNTVVIRHPDGTSTLYGHLSALGVQPGDRVTRGQPIGASGATGNVTGPHLHFGMYDAHGRPMDPRSHFGPAATPQPQAPQDAPQEPSPGLDQALGQLGIGQPSAPASVPAQEQPPMPSPQGMGGNPPQAPQPQGNGLQATPGEIALVRQLASDPRTYPQAEALVRKIQERAVAPAEYQSATVNGVPGYYNPRNPQGGLTPFAVPQEAMSHTRGPQDLGIAAPPGTYFSQSPTGDVRQITAPQSGQMAISGPGQPYAEQTIPGSRYDPQQASNRLDALKSYRGEIAPILTAATQLQRNINAVRAGLRQQNGAGDIAMINGLQRLIDEGVVREGDVALQLRAQGVNGGIAGLQGYIQSSGTFSPAIREQLSRAAEDIYGTTNATFRDRVLPYQGIVERTYGPGSFNDVVPEETRRAMGWMPPRPEEQRTLDTMAENQQRFARLAQGGHPQSAPVVGLPPKELRRVGQVYNTQRGPMKWTGTGWVHP